MSKRTPVVAIVGRANVGKSSLFNAIVGYRRAITANEPGTTRDSVSTKTSYRYHDFWLVDTAGYKEAEDDFELTIQDQIVQATANADVLLVVAEANVIITEEDRRVAKMALKSKKPVILVVNKIDKNRNVDLGYYLKLGVSTIFGVSATQKTGLEELLNELVNNLPKVKSASFESTRVAILGRPNVGKSSLFNTLAKKQQAIVAKRAGTTRDVNQITVNYHSQSFEFLDTAGIRRSGKIEVGVEKFSVLRSINAIEQADICLLLVDVNEPAVKLDQKIAGLVKEAGKGLILVISKWDSVSKESFTLDTLTPIIRNEFDFIPWAPLIFTSSITGQNVIKIFDLILEIKSQRSKRIKTSQLNEWLGKCLASHPPAGLKNTQPKLNYITQTDDSTPTFRVFGKNTRFLHWSYKRYLDRQMRESFGFEGTPIKFYFAEKTR
ncbi:ribosome biogenesis GTPase Der [Candidatus Saccharibacteria bacterium]|nr:ribosome biogenesis GTPase Der [Candidatus Saccharibacteria bacterium]HPW47897.1 ribosome biogenesis GTPase Der [Candidatus Saccharibacteria bacterium]